MLTEAFSKTQPQPKEEPGAGRPATAPSPEDEASKAGWSLLVEDARKILNDHHAPSWWGDDELGLIFQFFRSPSMLNPEKRKGLPDDTEEDAQRLDWIADAKRQNVIRWARMFSEAPRTMVEALPRIAKLIQKFLGESQRPTKSGGGIVKRLVAEYFLSLDVASSFHRYLWGQSKVGVVAEKIGKRLGLTVNARNIEDAREEIRRRLGILPRKRAASLKRAKR